MIHNTIGTAARDLPRLTLAAAPAAVALSTLTGHLVYGNPAFYSLLGLPTTTPLETLDLTTLCGDDTAAKLFESVARDGHTRQSELDMDCADHGRRHILCITSRVEDDQATPVWLASVYLQLQSQHLIEQRRLQELQHFLDAQRLAGGGCWQIHLDADDLSACIMLWSPGLSELLGQRPEILERSVAEFLQHLHPQDRTKWLAMLQQVRADHEPQELCYQLTSRSAATINMRSRSQLSPVLPGSVPTLTGYEQDLTELSQLHQRLEEHTALLHELAEISEHPLYAVDRSLRYLCFNVAHREYMLRTHGRAPQMGQQLSNPPANARAQRRTLTHLRRALAGQRVIHDLGEEIDGSSHRRDVLYQPIRDPHGTVVGVIVSEQATRRLPSQIASHWRD